MNRPFRFPNAAPEKVLARWIAEKRVRLPRGYIDGLTLSNDVTDAANDIVISAGECRSTVSIVDGAASTLTRDQIDLDLPVSVIKQLDVLFAPTNYDGAGLDGGTRSGGRSSSSISNSTWHAFLVGGGGLPTDVLLHDSITQASVFTEMQKSGGYSAYRHIGSVIRSGATILGFVQSNDRFFLKARTNDYSAASGSAPTTKTNIPITVPSGLSVRAIVHFGMSYTADPRGVYVFDFGQTDATPSEAAGSNARDLYLSSTHQSPILELERLTDTSGQISIRSSGANIAIQLTALGWYHPRGRNE